MRRMAVGLFALFPTVAIAQTQSSAAPSDPTIAMPKITSVLVIETPREGVTPQQIASVKARLMDHQYIPVGPLMPLRALNPAALR